MLHMACPMLLGGVEVGPFDITYQGRGTPTNGVSGAIATAYPSGIVAGDLLVLVTITRFNVDTTTPSGWTQQAELAHGSGTDGVDSGNVRVGIYTKVATGAESGSLSVSLASAYDVCRSEIFRFSKAGGTWSLASFTRAENPETPLIFSSLSGTRTFEPKDLWLVVIGLNGNVCVPNAAMVLDMQTGADVTTTTIDNGSTASGSDMAWGVARATMTTTDSIGNVQQAISGTPTADTPAGVVVGLRLRAA